MISQSVKEALQRFVPVENIRFDEPLKNHTTFRVGGAADCMVFVQSVEQMQKVLGYLQKVEIPFFVMGNGSNLLVGDKGYRGVILRLAESMSDVAVVGNRVIAKAGASLAKVARVALEHGLAGFEFAAGIPGTVGGAVIMNAGAYDGEMKMVVDDVTVMDSQGALMVLDNETMEFGYRTSAIKKQKFVVTECRFLLQPGNKDDIKAKMDDFGARRREKQPLEYASAGSTFKRPEGNFAGKLIMDAGLRGFTVGGAQVSEKHCGFVINTGDATAADIKNLMEKVQEEVYRQFSVKLEPEVIMLGEFA
ncbi:MAG: UDP-N-acetylmuramate dehydrogenase [Lachnospiraceae bacterium]|nr:UDP-N-acetylmuramate dehydrogenase [Lachnospiraceae bacterium]